jgi:hypothetical protein
LALDNELSLTTICQFVFSTKSYYQLVLFSPIRITKSSFSIHFYQCVFTIKLTVFYLAYPLLFHGTLHSLHTIIFVAHCLASSLHFFWHLARIAQIFYKFTSMISFLVMTTLSWCWLCDSRCINDIIFSYFFSAISSLFMPAIPFITLWIKCLLTTILTYLMNHESSRVSMVVVPALMNHVLPVNYRVLMCRYLVKGCDCVNINEFHFRKANYIVVPW